MRILIIKTGALGDVLRSSFIAQALKDKYRKYRPDVYWITDKKAMPLFNNNVYVDKVFLKENKYLLQNTVFNLIVNLEEDEENAKFASSFENSKKIGFLFKNNKIVPSESAKEWFNMSILGKKPNNDILKRKNKKTHRQILGEMLGINWRKYDPFLRLDNYQRKLSEDFLRRYNLSRSDLIIGINSGSADRWPKALPIAKTVKLIDSLNKKYPEAKIILFGGPNEVERNREIMKKAKARVIDTGCGNDLIEFPALISICSILITTDSLGLHISLSLKRKTLCLVGPTSPNELDMYDLGYKIIAKSKDVCSYKTETNCMNKIELNKILKNVGNLVKQDITIIITAFKEPKTIAKSIESALKQNTRYDYNIIVSAPDEETLKIAKSYSKNNKNLRVFQDPGKGKSLALNILFKKLGGDILILTDGDVYMNENSVEEISNLFLDPEIGCVTGRPVPVENKNNKFGYWANFLFEAAHNIRKEAFKRNSFIECSGYLFAFRKNKIESIPLDVAEDSVIPYYFWEKGYKIGYAEKAEVYVRNVDNWKDWINQKTRTGKAHETLYKYVNIDITPRVKTFSNEFKGVKNLIKYPKNFNEIIWTLELALARLYMWMIVKADTKIKKKHYQDAWERVESTK